MTLDPLKQRQVDLGAAAFFRPEAETPAGNQILVRAGFAYRGAFEVLDGFTGGDQTTAGFASVVSGAGFKRYDMVYIDGNGAAQIAPGVEVALAAPPFDGAPGSNLGPPMPEGSPVAYVLVDEVGAVTVDSIDITQINGFLSVSRDYDGYLVDKGSFGGAPAGISDDVSAMFVADLRIVPITGATEPNSGGGTAKAGFVTAAPLNYITLVDQNGDEVLHSTGARMYGRLSEAAGTWTLAYHYIDAVGAEQTMDPSTDTSGAAPTDVRLVGTPRVYSSNDDARPLFSSSVARLSDQLVGDIPLATTTAPGKVELATDGEMQSPSKMRAWVRACSPSLTSLVLV